MYYDTANPPVPTICWGMNLNNADSDAKLKKVGSSKAAVMGGAHLT